MSSSRPDLFTTFSDLLALVRGGESFVVVLPSRELARQLADPIQASIPSTRSGTLWTHSGSASGSIALSALKSPAKAVAQLDKVLRKSRPRDLQTFDIANGWYGSAAGFLRLFQSAIPRLRRRRVRSLWILAAENCSPGQLTEIRGEADLFARIWDPSGSGQLSFQVLSARQFDEPDVFLPRPVRLERGQLVLGPFGPGSSGPGQEAESPTSDRGRKTGLVVDGFRRLFEDSPAGMVIFDRPGTYRRLNRAATRILGYSDEALREIRLADILSPGSRVRLARAAILLNHRKEVTAELSLRRGNGRHATIHVHAFPLGGGLFAAQFTDTTSERKEQDHAALERAAYEKLFQEAPVAQAVVVDRRPVLYNLAFQRMFSVAGEMRDTSIADLLGKANKHLAREIASLADPGEPRTTPFEAEFAMSRNDGRTSRISVAAFPVRVRTKPAVHCTFVDVTEKSGLIQRLTDSEREARNYLQRLRSPLVAVRDGRITFANDAYRVLFGYAAGDPLEGVDFVNTIVGKDRTAVTEFLTSGKKHSIEYAGIRGDGTHLMIQANLVPEEADGRGTRFLQLHDLTPHNAEAERQRQRIKAAEVLLSADRAFGSSLELESLAQNTLQSLRRGLQHEIGGVFVLTSDRTGLMLAAHEDLSERLTAIMPMQNLTEGLTGFVARTHEPLLLTLEEYPPHLPYRSVFEADGVRSILLLPLLSGETLEGVVFLASRKKRKLPAEMISLLGELGHRGGAALANAVASARVKQSELRFRSLVEEVSGMIYRAGPSGAMTYISPSVSRLLGYAPADFHRTPDLWRTVVHPDDRSEYNRRLLGLHEGLEALSLTYRVLPRGKAAYKWVRDSVSYVRVERESERWMTGIVTEMGGPGDDHGTAEARSNVDSDLLESMGEGIAIWDTGLKCLKWNTVMEKSSGIAVAAAMGRPLSEISRLLPSQVTTLLHRAVEGEEVSSEDIRMTNPSTGEAGYYWIRSRPLKDPSGTISGVVLLLTDVTARTTIERHVRESEETLRNVIDGMGDALMICDLEGRVWEVNQEFTRITGYTRSEVHGMIFPYPWLLDEDMARFVMWIAELREKNYLRDFDMIWHARDGRNVAISINTSLLRNAAGEPVAMLNIARDISERTSLVKALERRNRELVALNAISTSINKSLRLDDVLKVAGEQIRDIMSARMVLIYLADKRKSVLKLGCYVGIPDDMVEAIRELHPRQSATGSVVIEGKPVLITNSLIENELVTAEGRKVLGQLGLKSLGVIPLRSKDEVLGALDVAFDEDHEFSSQEEQFLMLIGAQLGSAVENAQLYNEVRQQVQRLTSLYEVGRGLTGALDLNTILSIVYEEVRKAIPVEDFVCYSYSSEKPSLVPVFERHAVAPDAGPNPEAGVSPEDVYRDVLRNGSPSLIRKAGEGERLVAPVRSKGIVTGLLVVQGKQGEEYDDAHLRLLESIANLTEIALDKARLYVDIVNKSIEIEARNKELDDFTYVVSHDLKEPLISIEGYSKILLREFEESIGEEGKEFLSSLVHSSTRLKNLIDDLLALSRLGRVGEPTDDVPSGEVVREVISDIQFTLRERNATVEVAGELPTVRYNRTQLGIVFRNLISNAIKFNASDHPIVRISSTRENNEYRILVADNGIGIEERYFEKIFMIFQRLHRNEEYRGTGAGLTIVKKIVENHGGRVSLESLPGKGSTFSFTIPA
jgi:PAS domain S-box-containing protein